MSNIPVTLCEQTYGIMLIMSTSTLYRIIGMILIFFLLASAGLPVYASPRPGRAEVSGAQQEDEPGVLLYQERMEQGTPPPVSSRARRWAIPSPPLGGDGAESTPGEGPAIAPDLLRALLEAGADDHLRVIVVVREQADLQAAAGGAASATEVHSRIVSALQANAARAQAALRAYLEGARAAGLVESYTSLWIFNGIAVQARPSVIRALAVHPSVAAVYLDHWRQWITTELPTPNLQLPSSHVQSTIHNPQSAIHSPQSAIEWGVARIRADQVWASLHISGTGAVVAGMDTGVDWLHPALQANYRGYHPHGPANHTFSWYDATGGGALYPVDGHGHGTHTLGTAVGQGGIGVAPGAQWIAVKVLDNEGYGYDSWIHQGFQWLLAPGGDPASAPDGVNCSWGNGNGFLTTFQADLQALRAAGTLAVFSAGNSGPGEGTVNSPASLPGAFAVGATDSSEQVAYFSSRGPSPWGEIRPHVVAPGVSILSSTPGGAYDGLSGTSMAAPHVSGIVALLRSVSPTLSVTRTALLITSTAVPLSALVPNNDDGWGRVDAFAAVAALSQPGFVAGKVMRAGEDGHGDVPIAGATVVAAAHGGEGGGRAISGDDGSYLLALAPTIYDLTARAFGTESTTTWGVAVMTGTTTVADFSLTPLPTGTLRGRVTDVDSGAPVTATVSVAGAEGTPTPLETTASAYTFTLPAGTYTVRARSLGYRTVTATVAVTVGQVTVADLALPAAPSILLIDSGPWYQGSQAGYFRQALDDLAYTYDEWPIRLLPDDVPVASELAPYDVVVWSAPLDAPGYIGAQSAITGYLSTGGRLLLSGQDVGYLDGGGLGYSSYYHDYLKVFFVRDSAEVWTLQGVPGDLFAGLTITIAGAGGADNQAFPDEIAVADSDAVAPVLAYEIPRSAPGVPTRNDNEGGCGGVRIGTCLAYRAVYLSFGFEAINERASRREVMRRALDWLSSPLPTLGLELQPASQVRVGPPGSVVTHTLRVRHLGQGGVTDTVRMNLDGVSWAAQLNAPSLSLAPCSTTTVVVSVTVPSTAGWNTRDEITLTARSSLSPTLIASVTITTKAPAPILLVDDDRWYDEEDKYEAALATDGLPYDYWDTERAYGVPARMGTSEGSPPLDVLRRYPIVVWFTGYDWYAPVTKEEEETLAAYLDGGGRLFLSSQDFLYYHGNDSFSRDYLGVVTYTEEVTPTLVWGGPDHPVGERLGPYPLDYPFPNWSDAVVPAPGTAVPFRDQGNPVALARQEADATFLKGRVSTPVNFREGSLQRAVFFAFPFEALPEAGRAEVMERTIGWLSWLGGSTFAADGGGHIRRAASSGGTLTYTMVLRNDGADEAGEYTRGYIREPTSAWFSNTLPLSLTLVPGSLAGPAIYDESARLLSWEGALGPGAAVTFTYRVTVSAGLPAGTPITNTAYLALEDQGIRFRRSAVVRVDAPDLSPSAFECGPSPARPGAVVTCTLALANAGPGHAPVVTVTNLLPADTRVVSGSLAWTGGGAAQALTGTVRWSGPVSAGGWASVTYRLALPVSAVRTSLYGVALLEDGTGEAWERPTWVLLEPYGFYLPVVMRNAECGMRIRWGREYTEGH